MSEDKLYVTKSYLPPKEEYLAEIDDIWRSFLLTNMGPKHQQLNAEIKKYLGVENVELLSNGHMALELSLQSFGFSAGSEVITTPFSFASTTHAIVRNNLIPVFCDINKADYTIDVNMIESLISPRTVAILPVHVYGNICDIFAIKQIADRYGLKVIYDAAHSFGETIDGESIAKFGDVSCFSFHATKVFNTIEGGAACFSNEEIGKKLYRLKNFGIKDEEHVDGVGANAKMSEFSAAMGICNLRHLDEIIIKRKDNVIRYYEHLSRLENVKLCSMNERVKSNYAYLPIVILPKGNINRDYVCNELAKNNIFARKYFYPLISDFECYQGRFDSNHTPVAKWVSNNILTLPLSPYMTYDEVDRVCNIIKKCVEN